MIVSVTITDSREAEIGGAVKSVVDHVDRVLLVDTGVADRTVERAAEAANGKLVIVEHEWRDDFSAARNYGLQAAAEIGAKWIVVVDSDERIHFGELNLKRELAITRANILLLESSDGHYPKEKIVRVGTNARYVGPSHEVMMGGPKDTLRGASFSELPKTKEQLTHKFTRDVRILSAHVEKHPDDPRWWYYLGASYEGIGALEEAIRAFGECVDRRKIGDEAAWASYKKAEQLLALKRFDESVIAAARGLAANPTFAECAWIAAVAHSRQKKNDQATAWARMAEAIGLYKGCGKPRNYFRHLPALYELPYDVLRFSLPDGGAKERAEKDYAAAREARLSAISATSLDRLSVLELDLISVSRESPDGDRLRARAMLRPPLLSCLCPGSKLHKIGFTPPNGWQPMNPSVCWHKGELWCVIRTVNYTMSGKRYTVFDPQKIVRTQNYLGRLIQGNLVDAHPMRDLDPSPRERSNIVGYEDIRIVSIDGRLHASATVCDRDPGGRRLIARLRLDDVGDVSFAEVMPSNQLHEKNWLPISVDGTFTYIYSLDPTAILPYPPGSPGPLRNCPLALEHLRGGAAIPFGDGYLCVMHENIDTSSGRIYLHRFAWLDARFNVTSVSRAWVFARYGIEFCSGLAHKDGSLTLSYGIGDQEAWIAEIPAQEVSGMERIEP